MDLNETTLEDFCLDNPEIAEGMSVTETLKILNNVEELKRILEKKPSINLGQAIVKQGLKQLRESFNSLQKADIELEPMAAPYPFTISRPSIQELEKVRRQVERPWDNLREYIVLCRSKTLSSINPLSKRWVHMVSHETMKEHPITRQEAFDIATRLNQLHAGYEYRVAEVI